MKSTFELSLARLASISAAASSAYAAPPIRSRTLRAARFVPSADLSEPAGTFWDEKHAYETGGEGGIRTHVRVSPKHAFQACAFSHSATSPLGNPEEGLRLKTREQVLSAGCLHSTSNGSWERNHDRHE